MLNSEECRAKARACEELANETSDFIMKKFWLNLAREWHELATRVPEPRSTGVSGTEHSRSRAMVEQVQERGMELEQEREEARPEDLRVLIDRVLREVDGLPENLRAAIEKALAS